MNVLPSTSSVSASLSPSLAATSAPTRTSLSSRVSMTRLRASVFLSSDPIMPTEAPQPIGPREDARPAPGGLGLELALGQDAGEREGLALQLDRQRQLRREVVEPARSDIASCVTYSSGIVSPCMSAA